MSTKYSKAVKNLREEKGLSQAALADILGVSRQTVNYIEKDEKYLTPRIMSIIKEKFGDLVHYIDAKSITQADRFKFARIEILNKTQTNLAKELGINSQVITDIESGRKKKIDDSILRKFYEDYGIKIEWLLFGIGNKTVVEDDEDGYNAYFNEQVASIYKYDFTLSEEDNLKKKIDDVKDILYFDRRWIKNILGVNPNNLFFMYAPDDSMDSGMNTTTDIKRGDILFIDISQKEGNNNIFVFKNLFDNKPQIRQIQWSFSEKLKLIPKNKKYKSETIEKEYNEFMVNIIGRVVWNGSKEKI